jgi:hypothetical protein
VNAPLAQPIHGDALQGEIEPNPIEIDPRPCGLCGRTIDEHECIDQGEGPEFFCYPYDDIVTRWELADPRDRWKHMGEAPPPENVRNSDVSGRPAKARPRQVPQSTIDAFNYVVSLGDPEYLARWLRDHSDVAATLIEGIEQCQC